MSHPLADPELEVDTEHTAGALAADGAHVVDVREGYEREAGHIPGTRHVELERLASEASTIDRERPVIFYCRLGARSMMAAQAFRRAGFEAYSMAGGIQQWADDGRTLEPPDGRVADH